MLGKLELYGKFAELDLSQVGSFWWGKTAFGGKDY